MINFLSNWKTSLCGVLGAAMLQLSTTPSIESATLKEWLFAFGCAALAALGVVAKDVKNKDSNQK